MTEQEIVQEPQTTNDVVMTEQEKRDRPPPMR